MPKTSTAAYYRSHPAARKVKAATDAKINRRPDQVAKRVALNKYNRKHKSSKGDRMDASHKGGRIIGFSSQSRNRGDKNNSRGDRNARG